jgi:diguanylate cyclase (GGDEF)-like protein
MEIQHMTQVDFLTGLPNMPAFEEALDREIARTKHFHKALSLFFIDINNVAEITEAYGKEVGDSTLVAFGSLLLKTHHPWEFVARIDDTQFAIILPETPPTCTSTYMNKIRALVDTGTTLRVNDVWIQLDVSIGVVEPVDYAEEAQSLIARARETLDVAKKQSYLDPLEVLVTR